MLDDAIDMAMSSPDKEEKNFMLAAIGVRNDGTIVSSKNIRTQYKCAYAHAESRLSRKLDMGAVVFVARAGANGQWAMAKPCDDCQAVLRARSVRRVYYTIAPNEYGCMLFTK